MDAATKLDILRAVFLCAWADGEIRDKEEKVLSEILARIDIADEIHPVVLSWLTRSPEETPSLWERLSVDMQTAKTALYQIANMAAADHVFQFSELQMMERFREKLKVSKSDFQDILEEVERATSERKERS